MENILEKDNSQIIQITLQLDERELDIQQGEFYHKGIIEKKLRKILPISSMEVVHVKRYKWLGKIDGLELPISSIDRVLSFLNIDSNNIIILTKDKISSKYFMRIMNHLTLSLIMSDDITQIAIKACHPFNLKIIETIIPDKSWTVDNLIYFKKHDEKTKIKQEDLYPEDLIRYDIGTNTITIEKVAVKGDENNEMFEKTITEIYHQITRMVLDKQLPTKI